MDNYRFGIIASSVYNSQRAKASDKFFTPDDFFNFSDTKRNEPQSPEEMLKIAKMMAGAFA